MSKNRDGKPTQFQIDKIKSLGATTNGIKTYRDAENLLKRLANQNQKKKAGAKQTAAPAKSAPAAKRVAVKPAKCAAKTEKKGADKCKCNGKCDCHKNNKTDKHSCNCCESATAKIFNKAIQKKLAKKDAADRLPEIKNGFAIQRVKLPKCDVAKVQAEGQMMAKAMNEINEAIFDLFDTLTTLIAKHGV